MDLKIEELLDEEGLQVEIKTNNPKLLDFLLKEENFKKLIKLTIEEPNIDTSFDPKKSFKYPFVAADILSSESQTIAAAFFRSKKSESDEDESTNKTSDEVITDPEEEIENPDDTFLDCLFGFLDLEGKLNPTSAGYFCKVVNSLLGKRASDLFKYIYERRPDILDKMAKKTISKSISEVLAKLLTIENSTNEPKYIDKRIETINQVIAEFSKDRDIEEINNAAFIICEIFSKYNVMNGSNEILSKLLDQTTIDKFFEHLKSDNTYTVNAAALVLSNIIAYYILQETNKANSEYEGNEEATQEVPENLKSTESTPIVKSLAANIEHINNCCKDADLPEFENTFRKVVKPLGSTRLKLIELTSLAIKMNKNSVIDSIISSNLLGTLLQLFSSYEWNNMLHNQVEKIVNMILIDGQYQSLKRHLFEDLQFLKFIIKLSDSPSFAFSGNEERKIHKGYIGHIIRMSNKINESTDEYIKQQIEACPDWKTYSEEFLTKCNDLNKTNLGGRDPRAKPEEEDEKPEAQPDLSAFMQKFSKYFNSIAKKDDNDDDDDDNKNDDDQDNGDLHDQSNEGNKKHTIHIGFGKHKGRDQHEDDEDIEEDNQQWFPEHSGTENTSEGQNYVVHKISSEDVDDEEEQPESNQEKDFNLVNYWKSPDMFSAEDILKEAGIY